MPNKNQEIVANYFDKQSLFERKRENISFYLFNSFNEIIKTFEKEIFNFFVRTLQDIPKFYYSTNLSKKNFFDKYYWEGLFNEKLELLQEQILHNKLSHQESSSALLELQELIGKYTLSPLVYKCGLENLNNVIKASNFSKKEINRYDATINELLRKWHNILEKDTRFLVECFYGDIIHQITQHSTKVIQQDNISESLDSILEYYNELLPEKKYLAIIQDIKINLDKKNIDFFIPKNKNTRQEKLHEFQNNSYLLKFSNLLMEKIKFLVNHPLSTFILTLSLPIPYASPNNKFTNITSLGATDIGILSITEIFELQEHAIKSSECLLGEYFYNLTDQEKILFRQSSDIALFTQNVKDLTTNEKLIYWFSITKHRYSVAAIDLVSNKLANRLKRLEHAIDDLKKVNGFSVQSINHLVSGVSHNRNEISDMRALVEKNSRDIVTIKRGCDTSAGNLQKNITALQNNFFNNVADLEIQIEENKNSISDIRILSNKNIKDIITAEDKYENSLMNFKRIIAIMQNSFLSNISSLENRIDYNQNEISNINVALRRNDKGLEVISSECTSTSERLAENISLFKELINNNFTDLQLSFEQNVNSISNVRILSNKNTANINTIQNEYANTTRSLEKYIAIVQNHSASNFSNLESRITRMDHELSNINVALNKYNKDLEVYNTERTITSDRLKENITLLKELINNNLLDLQINVEQNTNLLSDFHLLLNKNTEDIDAIQNQFINSSRNLEKTITIFQNHFISNFSSLESRITRTQHEISTINIELNKNAIQIVNSASACNELAKKNINSLEIRMFQNQNKISSLNITLNKNTKNLEVFSRKYNSTSERLETNMMVFKEIISNNINNLQLRVEKNKNSILDLYILFNKNIQDTADQNRYDNTSRNFETSKTIMPNFIFSNISTIRRTVNRTQDEISHIKVEINEHAKGTEIIRREHNTTTGSFAANETVLVNSTISNNTSLEHRVHQIKFQTKPTETTDEYYKNQLIQECVIAVRTQNLSYASIKIMEITKLSGNHGFEELKKVIRLSYEKNLSNFNSVISFIRSAAPSMNHLLVGYDVISSEMLIQNQLYTKESIKLGFKIKEYSEMSNFYRLSNIDINKFEAIKFRLPSTIRDIYWNLVSFRNLYNGEYLDVFNMHCNDLKNGTVFTWSAEQTFDTNLWKLVTDDEGETFRIKYIKEDTYLSYGIFNNKIKNFITYVSHETKDNWKLEPEKIGFFKIKNVNHFGNLVAYNNSEKFDSFYKRVVALSSNEESRDIWEIKHRSLTHS